MTCQEFEAKLAPYVDGELDVAETASGDAHAAECSGCAGVARREREFRMLLRRQPRDPLPPELRAQITASIRAERRRAVRIPWLVGSGLAAAALVIALLPASRSVPPVVADLVDKHIAYAQIERPAELTTSSRDEVVAWFRARAGLRVTVPDFSGDGIRLVGARLAEAQERKAAYLLYEKGMTLLSVFMVSVSDREASPPGTRVTYRGEEYVTWERKGHRTVSWTDGRTLFGLVSILDYEALLECANRLRAERASETRL